MQVLRCDATLHDYLFYATTERGKVAETGGFLHNWALAYSFGWARGPWRSEVQAPHYAEELGESFTRLRAYVTPGRLLEGGYRLIQYNTLPDTYALPKVRGTAYPEWGFARCLAPGARFRFFVLSAGELRPPRWARFGKFMAKAEIQCTSARSMRVVRADFVADALLNWRDLQHKPVAFNLIANSFPSRLVDQAHFEQADGLRAEFESGESVTLPVAMGYWGQGTCTFD